MESVAGIFTSRAKAEQAINQLRSLGITVDRIVLLAPDTTERQAEAAVRTTETEQPGMGKAMGGAVGAAMGAAGGASLGAAAASLFIPAVGPIIAAGVLGAAILGIGGAVAGMTAGEALEESIAEGLPHDELYLYEDALRKGRSVVIAFPEDDETAERSRRILAQSDAESIDAAREDWWMGLRDVEQEHYQTQGRDFQNDEITYRRGFEAALNAKLRGKHYDQTGSDRERLFGQASSEEAFRRGYQRGLDYQKRLEEKAAKAAKG